ncbi:redox-sensing transcriptional repressor Rex [Treponema brennaborense]|uniref:Redox-sensing transcriptional repressor Rex n=1 Tax=Treponema brennaborense (strain DSM 12168 / CIP 105900 / DD5/3) TaxID=906968 RepID=F4LL52_TREBD|nr:redox-sensing transcriptional repressor Rex [Treponema brennaborense]AEE17626.1 Redox-sensing transcriptional repressor rex [Treponema brennaborense DSM 12168]
MPNLPEPTRKRLVTLEYLLSRELREHGEGTDADEDAPVRQTVTSYELAARTGWTDATIRRDISKLGIKCGASNGYNIRALREALRGTLDPGTAHDAAVKKCCIVGLGKIGAALLDYSGFAEAGFVLAAGFDESVNRVELLNASFPLYPASQLERVVSREGISYAVLTVSERDANRYAKRLASCGVAGIVNYTAALLTVPANTAVENVSVVHALRNLNSRSTVPFKS